MTPTQAKIKALLASVAEQQREAVRLRAEARVLRDNARGYLEEVARLRALRRAVKGVPALSPPAEEE